MSVTVMFSGNLGRDPERKTTNSGKHLVEASVGVQQGRDDTAWYRVTVWADDSPTMASKLEECGKGRRVDVVGRLKAGAFVGQGGPAASLEVTAYDVRPWPARDTDARPQRQPAPKQSGGGWGDDDSEIPF